MVGQKKEPEEATPTGSEPIENNSHNLSDITAYFNFLDDSHSDPSPVFTLQWFDDKSGKPSSSTLHLTLGEILQSPYLLPTNSQTLPHSSHHTLHTTLNSTDLKGRGRENIDFARVLCVDIDTPTSRHDLDYHLLQSVPRPHLIVESSPARYHLYWKVELPFPLASWEIAQSGLAGKFKGDASLSTLSHLIRVPGIVRLLKPKHFAPSDQTDLNSSTSNHSAESDESATAPILFLPRIIEINEPNELSPAITSANWLRLFPFIPDFAAKVKKQNKADIKKIKKSLEHANGSVKKVEVLNRNNSLFSLAFDFKKNNLDATLDDVLTYALHVNSSFTNPLPDGEVETVSNSAWKRGEERKKDSKANKPALPTAVELITFINSAEMAFYKQAYLPLLPPIDDDYPVALQIYSDALSSFAVFSDQSMTDYILKHNQDSLFRLSETDVFAFDTSTSEWKRQTATGRTVIGNMVKEGVKKLIAHPLFIPYYCRLLESSSVRAGIERILSHQSVSNLERALFTHGKIKLCSIHIFDSNPYLFKCANGVIDLAAPITSAETTPPAPTIRGPLPTDYCLCSSSVTYDPSATCPNWLMFLEEIFPMEDQLVDTDDEPTESNSSTSNHSAETSSENEGANPAILFLQEQFGYALTGNIDEQKVMFHVGAGANGKSKVLDVLKNLAGGYATIISSEDLGVSKHRRNINSSSIERTLSKIEGKRVVIMDDLATKIMLNEGLVKTLTYKEFRVEAKYQNSSVVPNRAKFHIGTNTEPELESENEAMIRRLCLIPYNQTFKHNASKSRTIDENHARELSGILNWAIAGLQRVIARRGIAYPDSVNLALEEYRVENFKLEAIIKETFRLPTEGNAEDLPGAWISVNDAVAILNHKLTEHSKDTITAVAFGREMKAVYPEIKTERRRVGGRKGSKYTYLFLHIVQEGAATDQNNLTTC